MSRFYHRPENALKRAEELIAVGSNTSALSLLHEIVMSKRSRSTPLTALEPIMLKFVELCVNLRKGKMAKEGLHQYKNISQNITVTTIEMVIKKFIELSENRVSEAQAKADKISIDAVEDLEASETPESIILSTVSGEGDKDRTDREVVTPWLKFLWEAYRTALDILRNNARLELLYQSIANQAFQFCLKYARKTEFRRLCELLRTHLSTAAKYAHQAHAINLNDPDTLQRHLDTRFVQLNAAAELQLWQEAFRSIEDIHNLLGMSKKPPKPFMMANYYEKLARIFMVGENYLFHAAAWSKYYATFRQNKNLSEDEHQRMSSIVLMSALAVPIISTSKTRAGYVDADDAKPKNARLANLLRVSRPPTRESLLKEALGKAVYSRVKPQLKELYQILEVEFHPLSICKKIAPILAALTEQKDLATYVRPLHQVILTRLLQQLSQVYTTIKIDSVVQLASFPEPYSHDIHTIEKFVMNGCKKGELSIRINHQTQTLTFETDLFAAAKGTISEGPQLQSLPSEQMRLQLVRLAKRLHTAITLIDPKGVEYKAAARKSAFMEAAAHIQEERKQAADRRILIEKKKELRENEIMRKEKEEQRLRVLKQQQDQEAERIRLEEESKRREQDRVQQVRMEIEKAEAAKLAAQLAGELKGRDLKMTQELQQLEKERKEVQTKVKVLSKKFDHFERAYRREEIPLLEKDYEEQKRVDKAYYVALRKAAVESARLKHEEDIQAKARMLRIMDDYRDFRAKLQAQRDEEFEAKTAWAAEQIARAKAQRIQEVRERKEAEKRRKEREEEERALREEEERRREEERLRQEEEDIRKREVTKVEEAERQRKLEEQFLRQQERERLAEEKIARQRMELRGEAPREAERGGAETEKWRPRRAEPEAQTPSAPGKYVPPSRRAEVGGDRGGDRWRRDDGPRRDDSTRPEEISSWRQRERQEPRLDDSARGSAPVISRPIIGAGKWRARLAERGEENAPSSEKAEADDNGFTPVRRATRR
ncbi:eukaryotic translation initiation factor 3 subunit A [Borealophlyctis nickersoniae]|nr:eukaryotic translation initiation factor 3 subunit A [Borealophlyctis nickersoniae]